MAKKHYEGKVMTYRIYADESGTHSEEWLIIGMLFVPDHGVLHPALCAAKDKLGYLNASPKISARYKEVHFTKFRSRRDVQMAKDWIDLFVGHNCYFRCVVIDWSIWDGKYFGDPFEPEAVKKRRAYKKWAEMLLQPELKAETGEARFYHAKFYLDRLRILYGYDVLSHLKSRFMGDYRGESPYIEQFQHTESHKDANQCLQLCDLLTGSMYQSLVPSKKLAKLEVRNYLASVLRPFGVEELSPKFWRQYAPSTLSRHFAKYSAWFWKPTSNKNRRRRSRKR